MAQPEGAEPPPAAAAVALDEDTIDEILYLARTDEHTALEELVVSLALQFTVHTERILSVARDSESGNGVFHMIAGNGHVVTLKSCIALVENYEIVHRANKAGNTPIHYAAISGQLEVAKTLMQIGADLQATNHAGHTAIYEAEQAQHEEVASYMMTMELTRTGPETVDEENGANATEDE